MSKLLKLFFLLSSTFVSLLYAKGTIAGTAIMNQAEIIYTLSGIEQNMTTNTDSFLVDQIIDLSLSWQDTSPVEVAAGDSDRVLTFVLTNLGNGEDNITLNYEHNSSSNFLSQDTTLFLDSNGNGVYDSGVDMEITDIALNADSNATLFIVANIPDDNNTIAGADSHDAIVAYSQGSTTTGIDDPHVVDVVIRTGSDRDEGIYTIRDYWLSSHKSAVVHSDDGMIHTGTIITYSIDLSIGGNADSRMIENVLLQDTIPVGTRYQAGSLRLDGISLTDAVDGDKGVFVSNAVHVEIGTLSGTVHQILTFDVQVQ